MSACDPRFIELVKRLGAGESVHTRDVDHLLDTMPRSDRLDHLLLFQHSFPPNLLVLLLAEWWTTSEIPVLLGQTHVVNAFGRVGFVTDTEGVVAPTEPLTVYRGVSWEPTRKAPPSARGVSWTLDEDRAEWFARRWSILRHRGLVFVADAPPASVLGTFHGRNEAEVMVNPRQRRKVRLLLDLRSTN
jgi:hypothetical protein